MIKLVKIFAMLFFVLSMIFLARLIPPVTAAEKSVDDYASLQSEVEAAPNDNSQYIIKITGKITFTGTLTVNSGKNIVIQSDTSITGSPFILTRTSGRHFSVAGSLTLEDIILDGSKSGTSNTASGGGVATSGSGKITINNGGVIQNCSAATGGGVSVNGLGSSFTMTTGGTIRGCKSTNQGGGVYVFVGSLLMTGGTVKENSSLRGGGVYGGTGVPINISGGTISDNTATYGGAIYGYQIDIFGETSIIKNTAVEIGGGIWGAEGASVTIGGKAKIRNNSVTILPYSATRYGGGVALDANSSFTLKDEAIIDNCSAPNGGGVGLQDRSNNSNRQAPITIKDSAAITNCSAGKNGGGVYVYDATGQYFTLTMDGGSINNNTAGENGGGIYGNGASINVSGGTISDNKAISSDVSTFGGGVYKSGLGVFTIATGTISGNSAISSGSGAQSYGGGVFLNGSSFVMGEEGKGNETVFVDNNLASYMAGGVDAHTASTVTMYCGTISNNRAFSDSGGATYAGGVEVYGGSTFTMKEGLIIGNSSSQYAGGVEVYSNSIFTMDGGCITNNTSFRGGGISVGYLSSVFTMNGGTIGRVDVGNTADDYGGGVYVYENARMTVNGGAIIGNTSLHGGGVFTDSQSQVELDNCSVINNTADDGGGAIYTTDETYANLKTGSDTVFDGNFTTIAQLPPANADADYDWLLYDTASIYNHPLNNYDINTSLTARLECLVTFNSMGGSGIFDQHVEFGDKVIEPPEPPTKTGHTFLRWWTRDMGTNEWLAPWDFTTTINQEDHGTSLVLYAEWQVTQYTLSFESNGGTLVDDQLVSYGDKGSEPAPPIKEGFNFEGWYRVNITFEIPWDFNNDSVMRDTTLFAKWIPTLTIEYYRDTVEEGNLLGSLSYPTYVGADLSASKISEALDNGNWLEAYWPGGGYDGGRLQSEIPEHVVKNTVINVLYTRPVTVTVNYYRNGTEDNNLLGSRNFSTIAGSELDAAVISEALGNADWLNIYNPGGDYYQDGIAFALPNYLLEDTVINVLYLAVPINPDNLFGGGAVVPPLPPLPGLTTVPEEAPLEVVDENQIPFSGELVSESYPLAEVSNNDGWFLLWILLALAGLAAGLLYFLLFRRRYITRGQFTEMVVKAVELEEVAENAALYDDVLEETKYYEAILRAKSAGLLVGFTGRKFNPDIAIRREEMASILAKVIRYEDIPVEGKPVDLESIFNDYDSIGKRFIADIELVLRLGIMSGKSHDAFDPLGKSSKRKAKMVLNNLLKVSRSSVGSVQ